MVLIAEIGDERWTTMYDEKTTLALSLIVICEKQVFTYIYKKKMNTNSGEKKHFFVRSKYFISIYAFNICYQHNLSLLLTSDRSSFCYASMLRIVVLYIYIYVKKKITHLWFACSVFMFRTYITHVAHFLSLTFFSQYDAFVS